ncbi:MAG: polysaccharide lyase beta-sandwich domain-containing protein [Oscillospiraceae bacterium]|nr:polysaccharide lyase beta-sandwich domain-containing protein [Oscillospiraceae bacterium]
MFYEAGSLSFGGIDITVSDPCIILLKPKAHIYELTISCPLAEVACIDFTLSAHGKQFIKHITMPQSGETGASVNAHMQGVAICD